MATTAKGAPYPGGTDLVKDGDDVIKLLAEWVDARPGIQPLTTAERDALAAAQKWTGRLIFNVTTGRLERYDGANWRGLMAIDFGAAGAVTGAIPVLQADGTLAFGNPTYALDDLTDVDLTGEADGDYFGRVGGVWVPVDAPSGGAQLDAGTYVGDGTANRTIVLPFDPKFVQVTISNYRHFSPGAAGGFGHKLSTSVSSSTSNNDRPDLTTLGFVVSGSGTSYMNTSGATYNYVAIG